ncbi:hypothetical protein [Thioclava pacifica]|uniref:hypothetical protein n=1 Tax=Thioclava pacifica TaxID=285109 RepID=UPI0012F828E9|nr:hypothetical protein [Thioclava pacifica]
MAAPARGLTIVRPKSTALVPEMHRIIGASSQALIYRLNSPKEEKHPAKEKTLDPHGFPSGK